MLNFLRQHLNLLPVVIFIFLDYLSGIISALYTKSFKSSIMREGLYHKCGELYVFAVAAIVDWAFPILGVKINFPFTPFVVIYLCIMELGSIIENVMVFSPEAGKALKDIGIKNKIGGDDDDGETNS